MNIDKLLTVAGLSGYDKLSATACLLEAKDRTTGLLLHKLHARLLMVGKIAAACGKALNSSITDIFLSAGEGDKPAR